MKRTSCTGIDQQENTHKRERQCLINLILEDTGHSVEKDGWPKANRLATEQVQLWKLGEQK